jgi:hypothetical protein
VDACSERSKRLTSIVLLEPKETQQIPILCLNEEVMKHPRDIGGEPYFTDSESQENAIQTVELIWTLK